MSNMACGASAELAPGHVIPVIYVISWARDPTALVSLTSLKSLCVNFLFQFTNGLFCFCLNLFSTDLKSR